MLMKLDWLIGLLLFSQDGKVSTSSGIEIEQNKHAGSVSTIMWKLVEKMEIYLPNLVYQRKTGS